MKPNMEVEFPDALGLGLADKEVNDPLKGRMTFKVISKDENGVLVRVENVIVDEKRRKLS